MLSSWLRPTESSGIPLRYPASLVKALTLVGIAEVVIKPESFVRSDVLAGILGLFLIKSSADELVCAQSLCTFTSAPAAIPASLFFSAVV